MALLCCCLLCRMVQLAKSPERAVTGLLQAMQRFSSCDLAHGVSASQAILHGRSASTGSHAAISSQLKIACLATLSLSLSQDDFRGMKSTLYKCMIITEHHLCRSASVGRVFSHMNQCGLSLPHMLHGALRTSSLKTPSRQAHCDTLSKAYPRQLIHAPKVIPYSNQPWLFHCLEATTSHQRMAGQASWQTCCTSAAETSWR